MGNLCLLKGKFNQEISNKVFPEKKQRYKDSKIEPNSKIAKYKKWDETSIKKRIDELYSYAPNIWKTE
ncbi:MAG: HNH endonuclease [Butyrivibrio sp.]|nr:HNH endonuclease [Butyrivibrio sp.]